MIFRMGALLTVLSCLVFTVGTAEDATPESGLKTEKEKLSYSIGYRIGESMKKGELDADITVLTKALTDAFNGKEALINEAERNSIITKFETGMREKMMQKMMKEREEMGKKNEVEGKVFLEDNKKKEGVKVTASGLQYQILKEGTGASPKATDTVKVHYKGTLVDGSTFDSSYDRKQPATFPLNGVIKGWTEGIQLMKVGGKAKFVIPSELGYGKGGGGRIPPNSVLVFEVELLGIETGAKAGK